MKNKKILKALRKETQSVPPVWLMRQAGRFLPEYRATRKAMNGFLDLCYTPPKAMEVTLQPITRFHMDAAIIFSDILVIPDALGSDLSFVQGEGPQLSTVTSKADLDALTLDNLHHHLAPVYEAVSLTKAALPDDVTLIGFAGSPWTVATYMVEGKGSKLYENIRRFMYDQPDLFSALIDLITEATIAYLRKKIDAGAEVIQLFDSWAGVLAEVPFIRYVIEPNRKIAEALKSSHPHIPLIGFPKGAGVGYERYIKEVPVDGVSLDFTVPLAWAAERLQPHVCVQGNLDPLLLASNQSAMLTETQRILDMLGNGPFIFNMGHGVIPSTPIENVEAMLKLIRG